jgi:hypothetical protein
MWLARPVYESLPYGYMTIGAGSLALSYWQQPGGGSAAAFALGCFVMIAGLVLLLHRQDRRRLLRDYPGVVVGDPPVS